jgi:integrase
MTIVKRKSGRYAVQVYDPTTARMRQLGTFDTKREAANAERDHRAGAQRGRETVGSFYARWMRDYPRPAESTQKHYTDQARKFADAHATKWLDQITRQQARAWALEHPADFPTLRVMFGDAYRDDLVAANPFANLGLNRKTAKRQLAPEWLTEADIDHLVDTARLVHDEITGELMASALTFAAYTGVRPGELYALEWRDLHGSEATIDRAARSGTRTIGLPKHHHRRTIVVPEPAQQALERVPRLSDRLVFPTPTGKQAWSPRWHGLWNPIRNAAGRQGMAWHELRHFAATWFLELGLTPADVALQLGHRDQGKVLLEVYAHQSERKARSRILNATTDHSPNHSQPHENLNEQRQRRAQ